jgi:hypothetical protein
MGLCRYSDMKLNNFGENLGWSRLTQTRVRSSQMLDCEYGNVWCLKMDQWLFFFILTRLWFSLLRCAAQTWVVPQSRP